MDEFDCGYIYCLVQAIDSHDRSFRSPRSPAPGDEIPIGRHPVLDLWNRPNKFYGRRTMEKAIGLSLKIDGNAYIWKVRNRTKGIVELLAWIPSLPLLPHMASRRIGIHRWLYDLGRHARYWLPVEDIIHIKDGIDPRNERYGLAAVKSDHPRAGHPELRRELYGWHPEECGRAQVGDRTGHRWRANAGHLRPVS